MADWLRQKQKLALTLNSLSIHCKPTPTTSRPPRSLLVRLMHHLCGGGGGGVVDPESASCVPSAGGDSGVGGEEGEATTVMASFMPPRQLPGVEQMKYFGSTVFRSILVSPSEWFSVAEEESQPSYPALLTTSTEYVQART